MTFMRYKEHNMGMSRVVVWKNKKRWRMKCKTSIMIK